MSSTSFGDLSSQSTIEETLPGVVQWRQMYGTTIMTMSNHSKAFTMMMKAAPVPVLVSAGPDRLLVLARLHIGKDWGEGGEGKEQRSKLGSNLFIQPPEATSIVHSRISNGGRPPTDSPHIRCPRTRIRGELAHPSSIRAPGQLSSGSNLETLGLHPLDQTNTYKAEGDVRLNSFWTQTPRQSLLRSAPPPSPFQCVSVFAVHQPRACTDADRHRNRDPRTGSLLPDPSQHCPHSAPHDCRRSRHFSAR